MWNSCLGYRVLLTTLFGLGGAEWDLRWLPLPPSEGGLGLIRIIDQYQALSRSLMIWVTMLDFHPLKQILQNHMLSSQCEDWEYPISRGWCLIVVTWRWMAPPTWQSLCKNWETLCPNLIAQRPVNIEEYRALPIWRAKAAGPKWSSYKRSVSARWRWG